MPSEDPQNLTLLEALHTTPARRYLSTETIGDDVVRTLLDAAVRGPSGGNTQRWAWIVVRDEKTKAQLAEGARGGGDKASGPRRDQILASGALSEANFRAADHLAAHLEEAPVWIIPVLLGAAKS